MMHQIRDKFSIWGGRAIDTTLKVCQKLSSEPMTPAEQLEKIRKDLPVRKEYSELYSLYKDECNPLLFGPVIPDIFPLLNRDAYRSDLVTVIKFCENQAMHLEALKKRDYLNILAEMKKAHYVSREDISDLMKLPQLDHMVGTSVNLGFIDILRLYPYTQLSLYKARIDNSPSTAISSPAFRK